MAFTKRIGFETLRSFDSASLTGTYQALGAVLAHPAYKLKLVNNSGVAITISYNGTTDGDIVLPNSSFLYEATFTSMDEYVLYPQGMQLYVKGTAGTGLIYVSVQYIIQS